MNRHKDVLKRAGAEGSRNIQRQTTDQIYREEKMKINKIDKKFIKIIRLH